MTTGFLGETKLLTSGGFQRLDQIVGRPVTIVNKNDRLSTVTVQAVEEAPTVTLQFDGSLELTCAQGQSFMTTQGEIIQAADLVGERLAIMPLSNRMSILPFVQVVYVTLNPSAVPLFTFEEAETHFGIVNAILATDFGILAGDSTQ